MTLANFTKFGGKESFMEFMNNFIIKESRSMHSFLVGISHPPLLNDKTMTASNVDVDSEIDLGKELSCMHTYLEENWTQELHDKASASDENMAQLQAIIAEIDMCRTREYTPQGTFSSFSSHQSTNPPSDYENNVNSVKPQMPKSTSRSHRTQPASHLDTSDDYVMGSAVSDQKSQKLFYREIPSNQKEQNNRRSVPFGRPNIRCHNVYDDTRVGPSARDGYHLYDEVSAEFDQRNADFMTPNTSADPADDEATDSEAESGSSRRLASRKLRRKSYLSDSKTDLKRETMRPFLGTISSSGYQSQNQSSYSSSSNSPVDTLSKSQTTTSPELINSYIKESLNYPTATTTSCSSSSSAGDELRRGRIINEQPTKTRSNYRARSVTTLATPVDPRMTTSQMASRTSLIDPEMVSLFFKFFFGFLVCYSKTVFSCNKKIG